MGSTKVLLEPLQMRRDPMQEGGDIRKDWRCEKDQQGGKLQT